MPEIMFNPLKKSCAGVIAAAALATAASAQEIKLTLADQNSPTAWGPTHALQPWVKQIEDATKGRVKIEIFPSQTLVKGPDMWRQVRGEEPLEEADAVKLLKKTEDKLGLPAVDPLRTGVDGTFAPHAMPKLGGGVEGFQIDLFTEVARRMHREITIDAVSFSTLIPGMQSGRYDFIAAPTTVTKERAENMLFTAGYLWTAFQFGVKKGTPPMPACRACRSMARTNSRSSSLTR